MRVPDLEDMIEVEEYRATSKCIHCGQIMLHHAVIWRTDINQVGWMCKFEDYPYHVGNACYYETSHTGSQTYWDEVLP